VTWKDSSLVCFQSKDANLKHDHAGALLKMSEESKHSVVTP